MWIRGLTTNYYKIHFSVLLRQFIHDGFTPSERKTLARQVIDFSVAQRDGFINAYMDVFGESNREEVMKFLKGCQQHFKAQVTRVQRNRSIVPADCEVWETDLLY